MLNLITVIITTYKRNKHFLLRALRSVDTQTYKNVEIILVNDNDNQEYIIQADSVLNEIKSQVTHIKHGINRGAQTARNTGLSCANGDYIAFLDDDDEWLPKKLEIQMESFITGSPRLGLVACAYYQVNIDNKKKIVINNQDITIENLLYTNIIGSTSFPLIKKECFDAVGSFDINLQTSQDYDMWIRILTNYDGIYVSTPLVNYYIHEGEQISKNIKKKYISVKYLYEKHYDLFRRDGRANVKIIKRLSILAIRNLEFNDSVKYSRMVLRKRPYSIKQFVLLLLALLKINIYGEKGR